MARSSRQGILRDNMAEDVATYPYYYNHDTVVWRCWSNSVVTAVSASGHYNRKVDEEPSNGCETRDGGRVRHERHCSREDH